MSTLDTDLIVAVATPPGQGGVGIVRLSGPGALQCAQTVCGSPFNAADFAANTDNARRAYYCDFSTPDDREQIDSGLAIWFAHGSSFTGEEVVELHAHGSPVVLQRLIDACCVSGARMARAGEFSERAFLHGQIDLAQAEAIADLIASTSVMAARGALRSLSGEFSALVNAQAEALAQLRIYVEATIDFPDEEVEHLANGQVAEKIAALQTEIAAILASCAQGRLMREGIHVALLGAPNAGKSSLLNALSGEEAAIVTDLPGTTRDLLKVDVVLDGLALRLVDTAGLRDSTDEIEQIGVARALEQARTADLIIEVIDAAAHDTASFRPGSSHIEALADIDAPRLTVMNKLDLVPQARVPDVLDATESPCPEGEHALSKASIETTLPVKHHETVWVSAVTGLGLDRLREAIKSAAAFNPAEATFTARARHVHALQAATGALEEAAAHLAAQLPLEMAAEELRAAHAQLGEIVGTVTPDDLLGRIFSEFCIGK